MTDRFQPRNPNAMNAGGPQAGGASARMMPPSSHEMPHPMMDSSTAPQGSLSEEELQRQQRATLRRAASALIAGMAEFDMGPDQMAVRLNKSGDTVRHFLHDMIDGVMHQDDMAMMTDLATSMNSVMMPQMARRRDGTI